MNPIFSRNNGTDQFLEHVFEKLEWSGAALASTCRANLALWRVVQERSNVCSVLREPDFINVYTTAAIFLNENVKIRTLWGVLYSPDADLPAIEYPSGSKVWYRYGGKHRVNGPAAIFVTGEIGYYEYGLLHRYNGPALITQKGSKYWYCRGRAS